MIVRLSKRRLREACRNAALSGGHVAPELGLGQTCKMQMDVMQRDASSEIVRYKARLVAKVYSQVAELKSLRHLSPWRNLSSLDAFLHWE